MYIVGKYYQGNPDQKPEQWGSIADVQYAVRANCEDWIGVDYDKVAFAVPGWSGSGGKIIDLGYRSSGFGSVLRNGNFDSNYGINLINPSYAYLNSTLHNNNGEEFSLFFDFIKRGSSTSRSILAGYDYNITYGYVAAYPGIRARIRFNTSVDFTSIRVFSKRNQLVFVCDKNKNVKAYQNALLKQTISVPNTEFDFNQIGALSGTYAIDDATIYNSFGFKTALNTQQVELLSNQPSKLFQPVSRPLYFDFTDLPVSPEYASVISEKVNTISDFQKEGLFSTILSEKTNLISGFEKQAEISPVLSEKSNILSVGSASEEISYSSIVSEKTNITSDGFKQAQIEKTISESTNLESSAQKTGYYASAITEKTNITSTGSSEDVEVHSYSLIISEKERVETGFFKGAVTDSFISEETNLNSEFYKTSFLNSVVSEPSFFSLETYKAINYQSIISERVNLISIIAGGLLVRPVLNTSIKIEEDRLTILLTENTYSYGIEQ